VFKHFFRVILSKGDHSNRCTAIVVRLTLFREHLLYLWLEKFRFIGEEAPTNLSLWEGLYSLDAQISKELYTNYGFLRAGDGPADPCPASSFTEWPYSFACQSATKHGHGVDLPIWATEE
jgi:hypothetical protein